MTVWKVVPVEPTEAMTTEIEHSARMGAIWTAASAYTAMLAAAPTPPVVLPPLPPHPEHVYVWTDDEKRVIEEYARAALAQYGIRGQSDE